MASIVCACACVRACARVYVDDHIRSYGDHAWFFNSCRNGKGGLFMRMFREECLSGLVIRDTQRLKCAYVQNVSLSNSRVLFYVVRSYQFIPSRPLCVSFSGAVECRRLPDKWYFPFPKRHAHVKLHGGESSPPFSPVNEFLSGPPPVISSSRRFVPPAPFNPSTSSINPIPSSLLAWLDLNST